MYRVVLIDDENIILDGLKTVVKWKDFGCEVVGTANDAQSGAELIRSLRPHILFADIRMPGVDGLTMLQDLRQEFSDMQVTILSGYSDFQYAQEAIKLGVTRFILKPSKMSDIHEALQAMAQKLSDAASSEPEEKEEVPEGTGNFIVTQALQYMESCYASKLTLQEVADHCFVSQWHLSKLLNRYEHQSFFDILNDIRIRHAKELLASGSLKIADVSDLTGYADPAHFARIFKKHEGISANEYRNSLGKL